MDSDQQILRGRCPRGFTILEAMISTAVVGVLMVGFIQILTTGTMLQRNEFSETNVESSIRNSMENLVFEIQEARYGGLTFAGTIRYDYGDSFTYSVPMKDVDGRPVLDANGAFQFGTGYPGAFTVGATYTIVFIAGTRSEDTIKESVLGQDVNGDGDIDDTFEVGTLRQTCSDNTAYLRTLGGLVVRDTGVGAKMFLKQGENFQDTNLNGIYDATESYQDANGNSLFDIGISTEVMFIDPDLKTSKISFVKTQIKLRNTR